MRRLALAVTAALAAWAVSATGAAACRFIQPVDARAQLERTDVLFVGRAESSTPVRGSGGRLVDTRFRVSRTVKGPPQRVQVVRHSVESAACGLRFRTGRTFTVLANRQEGRLWTSSPKSPFFPLEAYERAADRGPPRR